MPSPPPPPPPFLQSPLRLCVNVDILLSCVPRRPGQTVNEGKGGVREGRGGVREGRGGVREGKGV